MSAVLGQVANRDASMFNPPVPSPGNNLFSVLRFHGWEVAFECGKLTISSDAGLRVIVKEVSPTFTKVRVPTNDAIEIAVCPFPIQMHIRDESVRDWIIRFLAYWGFCLEGVRVEAGVILFEHTHASEIENTVTVTGDVNG